MTPTKKRIGNTRRVGTVVRTVSRVSLEPSTYSTRNPEAIWHCSASDRSHTCFPCQSPAGNCGRCMGCLARKIRSWSLAVGMLGASVPVQNDCPTFSACGSFAYIGSGVGMNIDRYPDILCTGTFSRYHGKKTPSVNFHNIHNPPVVSLFPIVASNLLRLGATYSHRPNAP